MIPKIIWQTHKFSKENMPGYIVASTSTWKYLNPEYKYNYISNDDCFDFVKQNFDKQIYELFCYKRMSPRNRFDIWRILCLYKYGGIYADCDLLCLRPIDSFLDLSNSFAMKCIPDNNGEISLATNDFIASEPMSIAAELIIKEMVNTCMPILRNGDTIQTMHTGPELYLRLYNDVFKGNDSFNLKMYTHQFDSPDGQGVFDIVGSVTWNDINIGINIKYLESIFNRYIDSDDSSTYSETGINPYHRFDIKVSRNLCHGG